MRASSALRARTARESPRLTRCKGDAVDELRPEALGRGRLPRPGRQVGLVREVLGERSWSTGGRAVASVTASARGQRRDLARTPARRGRGVDRGASRGLAGRDQPARERSRSTVVATAPTSPGAIATSSIATIASSSGVSVHLGGRSTVGLHAAGPFARAVGRRQPASLMARRLDASGRLGDDQKQVARHPPAGSPGSRGARPCPPTGVVIAASIFIASIDATCCPASTVSPSATLSVTTPENGAATCPGWVGIRLLGRLALDGDAAVAHEDRSQLPVERRHDGAHALVVGLADRLEPDEQVRRPGRSSTECSTPVLQPVEVVGGVEHRQVAVRSRAPARTPASAPANSRRLSALRRVGRRRRRGPRSRRRSAPRRRS